MRRFPKVRVHAATVLLIACLVMLDGTFMALVPICAVLCHELGHIFVMRLLGVFVGEIEVTLFGAEIRSVPRMLNTAGEIAVYSAGAAANILTAGAVYFLFLGEWATLFVICSLSLAVFNLLPIKTLDGGCIFEAVCQRFASQLADKLSSAVSTATLLVLWLAAVYLLLLCGGNLSLMLFCIYMFVNLYLRDQ